ncbi:hypothetical protein B0T13DRAFT_455203 [Neurospora crassa]|nr:hypothetical protein B0T13DRAFT_455203 [Neurospora crassa]
MFVWALLSPLLGCSFVLIGCFSPTGTHRDTVGGMEGYRGNGCVPIYMVKEKNEFTLLSTGSIAVPWRFCV